jgi:hypothetical protein
MDVRNFFGCDFRSWRAWKNRNQSTRICWQFHLLFSLTNFQTFQDYFGCFGKFQDFSRSGSETCENYSRISKLRMNPAIYGTGKYKYQDIRKPIYWYFNIDCYIFRNGSSFLCKAYKDRSEHNQKLYNYKMKYLIKTLYNNQKQKSVNSSITSSR